jgi:hypothetical protein
MDPPSQLWATDACGHLEGTRQTIHVLGLIRPHGHVRVRAAVKQTITLGCVDAAAARHLVEAIDLTHAADALSIARFTVEIEQRH